MKKYEIASGTNAGEIMTVERRNYVDMSVELVRDQGIGDETLYLQSELFVSEQ